MDTLHKHNYDLAIATCSLVPNTGPILVKDQMEDWSAAEANSFEDAIEKCGKDFGEIQKEHVKPRKRFRLVFFYINKFSYHGKV
jgi:metastasis-associated protein MTA